MKLGKDVDNLELQYRQLYWELNELQLVLPDSGEPEYVEKAINEKQKDLRDIEGYLGYVPQP